MISEHIPDIELITYCAENERGALSRLSPWTKLISLFLLIVLITLLQEPELNAALFAAVLLVYAWAGLPIRKLFAWYLFPAIFVFSLAGIMMWFQPGTPLFVLWPLGGEVALTREGLLLLLTLLLKAFASFTFTLAILMTTRYEHLVTIVERILPYPIDQMMLLAYRFVFISLAMIRSMLKALRSRGGGALRGLRMRGTMIPELIAIAILRTLERAERVQRAMRARGYDGRLSSDTPVPSPKLGECAFLVIFASVIALEGMKLFVQGSI